MPSALKMQPLPPMRNVLWKDNLKKQWKSPNGTIRAMLDGIVFRKPIMVKNIKPAVRSWKQPIVVGRLAYGDVYKNAELYSAKGGKLEIVATDNDGKELRETIIDVEQAAILQGVHNTPLPLLKALPGPVSSMLSIRKLIAGLKPKTLSPKFTINASKLFLKKSLQRNTKPNLRKLKLSFFYTLIDDVVARMMKSSGGMLWVCKNYDGDVMSDMVASAFCSLAMMSSVLVSPYGYFEYEAAYGTMVRFSVTTTNISRAKQLQPMPWPSFLPGQGTQKTR